MDVEIVTRWYERPAWRAVGYVADVVTKCAAWFLGSCFGAITAVQILVKAELL